MSERLNRFLARRGVASRRAADRLIASGRVEVNGRPAVVGSVVRPEDDRVSIDGRAVATGAAVTSLLLNKPAGTVTAVRDPQRRPTVMDMVPAVPGLVPVGRLDVDTRGLLLLTTDGELAHRVSHPRYGVHKTYRAVAAQHLSEAQLRALNEGFYLDDGFARPLRARRVGPRILEVVMGEGRKREVRRLCAAAGIELEDLRRTQLGPLRLGALAEGAHRMLTDEEDRSLRAAVGLPAAGNERRAVVTVDGPAGSGKSTVGARVASTLGLRFVDTGLFYRGLAVAAARAGVGPREDRRLVELASNASIEISVDPERPPGTPAAVVDGVAAGPELYDPAGAALLARVSNLAAVRAALLHRQRAAAGDGAVAAGRDCGTVVFPDAAVKVYLQAPEPVRAERRAAQLSAGGRSVDAAVVSVEIAERDRSDSTRDTAPLQPARDAHIIDTEHVGIEELVRRIVALCNAAGLHGR